MKRERIFEIWRLMVGRCHNQNWNNYYTKTYYRDKGITVCDEWRFDFQNFKEWAMSNGYSDTLSIDRINPDGNYEPCNCRWITLEENRARARKGTHKRRSNKCNQNKVGRYEVRYSSVYGYYHTVKCGLMYHDAKVLQGKLEVEHRSPGGYYYNVVKTEKR